MDLLGIEKRQRELDDHRNQSQDADFWSDPVRAQKVMQKIAELQSFVEPWIVVRDQVQDLVELSESEDTTLQAELEKSLYSLQQSYDSLKQQLRFRGEYDRLGAIITLTAGAGGTDAQDWTQMLFRMYSRWAEKQGFTMTILDEAAGEEAGLKRVVASIEGSFAYGQLRAEHGVHRLVRLSPFNADNLRQTSFAKVEVVPKIDDESTVDLDESSLKIDVFRAGGHGGQSVNTTDSAVRITHIPTGITVSIQNERSQLQNKATALTILRSRLAQLKIEQHQNKINDLKGPNQSAEWGNQIRSYVLHPYKQVKDVRTKQETSNVDAVLNGDIQSFIDAYLEQHLA